MCFFFNRAFAQKFLHIRFTGKGALSLLMKLRFLPFFSSGRGATLGLLAAAVFTSIWYVLGNPFGIDNMYIAAVTPLGIDVPVADSKMEGAHDAPWQLEALPQPIPMAPDRFCDGRVFEPGSLLTAY